MDTKEALKRLIAMMPPAGATEDDIEYVVCCRKENAPDIFDDNLEGECSHCKCTVVFRPHSPKKPSKICFECMCELMDATRQ